MTKYLGAHGVSEIRKHGEAGGVEEIAINGNNVSIRKWRKLKIINENQ